MEISIVTVTFNNDKNIDVFLKSIFEYAPKNSELIIVDNSFLDNTRSKILEFKKKHYNKITLIESVENSGFSKANNLGARSASNEILVFLNPDTKILKNSLEELSRFIVSCNDVGVVGPAVERMNGDLQPSVRNLPTLKRAIDEYIFGKKSAYSEFIPESKDPLEVESIYGTCMVLKKNFFEKIGGFNEEYFLYYEDLDLCRKIMKEKLKIYYIPQAKIQHVLGGSNDNLEKNNQGGLLTEFFPINNTGRKYYQIQSSNIYHGFLISFMIHLTIFISQKLRKLQ